MGLILTRKPKDTINIHNEEGEVFGKIEVMGIDGGQVKLRFHGFKKNKIMRSELNVSDKIFNKES